MFKRPNMAFFFFSVQKLLPLLPAYCQTYCETVPWKNYTFCHADTCASLSLNGDIFPQSDVVAVPILAPAYPLPSQKCNLPFAFASAFRLDLKDGFSLLFCLACCPNFDLPKTSDMAIHYVRVNLYSYNFARTSKGWACLEAMLSLCYGRDFDRTLLVQNLDHFV